MFQRQRRYGVKEGAGGPVEQCGHETGARFALMLHRVVNAVWEPRVVVYPERSGEQTVSRIGGALL